MKINPNVLRKKVIDMVVAKQSGHIGGAFSMAELTSVLYEDYEIGGKDKLILSKGHAVPIIYAVLHELGQISDDELDLFREIDQYIFNIFTTNSSTYNFYIIAIIKRIIMWGVFF